MEAREGTRGRLQLEGSHNSSEREFRAQGRACGSALETRGSGKVGPSGTRQDVSRKFRCRRVPDVPQDQSTDLGGSPLRSGTVPSTHVASPV